ncbi:sigma-70 family RNA polymerase sigma factor [Mesorhizobium sp. J428]|uniref:sigma-70 family RNA polymerase sigma factor n=1 Tax=Mesorhizobium sp. J428 TaxID=2898440 RepID=UPI00215183BD|nr:sigma-70 family RNA polymerase sigma factor [Mesorhizobium sp. J428]MCR5858181.1 sigma-70 family RNA polymerase sigma factor [Mesorhizobium sp. J428]
MQDLDDETLVLAVVRGDQRAFRVLMDRHMGRSIRFTARLVGNSADADEIAQEAFIRVWRHAARFDSGRARFSTWLYQILTNLALDRRRKRQHEGLAEVEEVAEDRPAADDILIDLERRRLAAAAIASLPDRQRAAVVLFHLDDVSVRDGASILGVSEKSFESLLTRGRSACRDYVNLIWKQGEQR